MTYPTCFLCINGESLILAVLSPTYAMECRQPSWLDLPLPLLSHIVGLLAKDHKQHLARAKLTCRQLWQAGEAVQHMAPLRLTSAKLRKAHDAGCKGRLLAWVARKGQLWREVVVEVDSLRDLRPLVQSLAASRASRLQRLELRCLPVDMNEFRHKYRTPENRYRLPKELGQLTGLTELSIWQDDIYSAKCLLGPELTRLSTLAALRSLALNGKLAGCLPPPETLPTLQQLTSLTIVMFPGRDEDGGDSDWEEAWEKSLRANLLRCTALRCLHLYSEGPVPSLSEHEALAAWQHLEDLKLVLYGYRYLGNAGADAGFWRALPQLPCLTRLSDSVTAKVQSRALSTSLPARLASLELHSYSEPAFPPLPLTLTALHLDAELLTTLPVSPSLRDLKLGSCDCLTQWPSSTSAMVHLTRLWLWGCHLEQLPAELAALPALVWLDLRHTDLTDMPRELACVTCLRWLDLGHNKLTRVPAVLGGGAASRLKTLCLEHNPSLVVGVEGLGVLQSLTALTYLDLEGLAQEVEENVKAANQVLRKAVVGQQRWNRWRIL